MVSLSNDGRVDDKRDLNSDISLPSARVDYHAENLVQAAQALNKAKDAYDIRMAQYGLSHCLDGLGVGEQDKVLDAAARICMSKGSFVTLNTIINAFPDCEIERSVKPTTKLVMAVIRGNLYDAQNYMIALEGTSDTRPQFLDSKAMEKLMQRGVLRWIEGGDRFCEIPKASNLSIAIDCAVHVLGKEKAVAIFEDNAVVEAFKGKLKRLYLAGCVNDDALQIIASLRDRFTSLGSAKYAEILTLDYMCEDLCNWAVHPIMSSDTNLQYYRPESMIRIITTYGQKALDMIFAPEIVEKDWKPFIKRILDESGIMPKWCEKLKQYKEFKNIMYSDEIVRKYADVIEAALASDNTRKIPQLVRSLANDLTMLKKLALYPQVQRAFSEYVGAHPTETCVKTRILPHL